MYPILSIVYGVPVNEKLQEVIEEVIEEYFEENDIEEEDYGYERLYHGGLDETPAYVGVRLKRFPLLEPSYSLDEITNIEISESQKTKTEEYINKFPNDIKKYFGKVGLYLMNSSS